MRETNTNSEIALPVTIVPIAASRLPIASSLLALLLAFTTILLYWPATHCGFINFDDNLYVTANAQVQHGLTLDGLKWAFVTPVASNWHPVTMLSHMLDCQLFGLNPWGPHLINVLLHAANTALVFLLLQYLTGALWRSVLVAAFFGLHPLHVESVAWVAERKDVLSTFFGLLSLIFYARYTRVKIGNRKSEIGNYLLGLLFLALGLMSKPMLVTWPFVLLLLDYWPLERFKQIGIGRLLIEKIPFLVLATAVSIVTFLVQQHSAAVMSGNSVSIWERSGNAMISYCCYLEKIFWPTDLSFFYPYPRYLLLWEVLAAGAILMGITLFLCLKRRGWPFMLMGWLWFLGTLVPVIGLIQVGGQAMADRYMYIPSLGVFIVVIWGIHELASRWRLDVIPLSGAGLVALVFCIALTRQQLGYWLNSETLMRHALAVTQNNYMAHDNLAAALDSKGQFEGAIREYQEAILLKPNDPGDYYNLGVILDKARRHGEAMLQYQEAIRLNTDDAQVYNNLGIDFAANGKFDEAVRQYQEAIRLKPNYAQARFNLGIALDGRGQPDAAIIQYQEAIRLNPDYSQAHYNLGIAFDRKGQLDEAIQEFQEVIRLDPDDAGAHNNLGVAFYAKGEVDEAILQYQEAIRLDSSNLQASNNLAAVLRIKNAHAGH